MDDIARGGDDGRPLGLTRSLFDAKLTVPRLAEGAVSRAALIDAARNSASRVISLTAPAGYGKSTMLAEWAHAEDRPVGWVSLDRFDDDPSTLLYLLASAFGRASRPDPALTAGMSGLGTSALGRAAPRLAAALGASPNPWVLMVDDLHELQSPACHDVLGVVTAGIPAGSQLVIASRSVQPHLARLRTQEDVVEYGPSHLALDAAGARRIFAGADVELSMERAADVSLRTEGWPVGIRLAALIAREAGQDTPAIAGDDRYVAEYLYREALATAPDAVQQFLRRTSVLDQLNGPLCDAVLAGLGSEQMLRSLEEANAFLVPLDRRRDWYRYHGLFREFLQGELRRTEPGVIQELHLRAADWYDANGFGSLAVEHLLDTDETLRTAQMVSAHGLATYLGGQRSAVERWLAQLGDESIRSYPPVAVLATWVASLGGNLPRAQALLAFLDSVESFEPAPVDGSASFESARAMVRSLACPDGPSRAVADALIAIDAESAWSPWRDQALVIAGEAYLLTGDHDRAIELFEATIGASEANGPSDATTSAHAELALLDMAAERWTAAETRVQAARAVVEECRMNDYMSNVLVAAVAARLAVHRGDHAEAALLLTQAMRARTSASAALPGFTVRSLLQTAKGFLALGDPTTARHLLREMDDVLRVRPDLGALVGEVEQFREAMTDIAVSDGLLVPLSPAELRLLPYLQTHLTFREVGERLFVSRNTVSSQVASIYQKLAVSSRSDAVDRATAIGLIGG